MEELTMPTRGAQGTPIGFAVALAEQFDLAAGGCEVAGERGEERGFARAVGAEDDPVLAAFHAPVHVAQDADAIAADVERADVEDGWLCGAWVA